MDDYQYQQISSDLEQIIQQANLAKDACNRKDDSSMGLACSTIPGLIDDITSIINS
jgi:hypothetical protein